MAEQGVAPAQGDAPLTINLRVVSPSVDVNGPLNFQNLSASTTVRQLKDKIREVLSTRPPDEQQRLIHRGRLLARDDETLEHIFGAAELLAGGQQTIHLALRDISDPHAQGQGTPFRGQSPAPSILPPRAPETQQRALHQHLHQHPHPVHTHLHQHPQPQPHQQPFLPGNRPLTAPILQLGQGLPPLPFNPPGLPAEVAGNRDPQWEQHIAHIRQINRPIQREAPPVPGSRASPNPFANGQDPANQLGVQLGLQLALIAQQQDLLTTQAEQLRLRLANQLGQNAREGTPQQLPQDGHQHPPGAHPYLSEMQHLVERAQRERAALGLHGIQDNGQLNIWGPGRNMSGRNSPASGQPVTVTREMVGPNGQHIRTTTTTTIGSQTSTRPSGQPGTSVPIRGPMLPPEIQNLMRSADAGQASQTITNAMHRSASGASLANMANSNASIQPIAPGVTTSIFNPSRHPSRTATPDPSVRGPGQGSSSVASSAQTATQGQTVQGQPEVYILSSPNGPRALLITNHDAYVTLPTVRQPAMQHYNAPPALRQMLQLQTQMNAAPRAANPQGQPRQVQPQPLPQGQNLPRNRLHVRQRGVRPADMRANNNHVANRAAGVNLQDPHPRPPNAGAVAVLAALWPHVWLLIRLAAFVWWFTASDSSWSRWITVVLIAMCVFAVNTGLFNGIANQAWDPFRRHLEGLLPLADPNRPNGAAAEEQQQRLGGAEGNAPAPPADGGLQPARNGNPDPAEVAARLVARRRDNNANWLMDQVRRIERAGLLFLASIAPGVAERHIQHLEEQERAATAERERVQEQTRREAEERETREAIAANTSEQEQEQHQGEGQVQEQGQEQERHAADGQRQEGPLIPV